MDASKRTFLRGAGVLVAGEVLARNLPGFKSMSGWRPDRKVVVAIIGGIRRKETFAPEGRKNIPHISGDLFPQSLFYSDVRNEGTSAHFNAISSILTGTWQRVGDWGELSPTAPTLFEYFRKQLKVPAKGTWIVASNKALTNLIGAGSTRDYGPAYGANVVFPKQLMINAVVEAIRYGKSNEFADREKALKELEAMLGGSNYEGLGWTVFDVAAHLDPEVRETIRTAIADLVHGNAPLTGDQLTFLVGREIMRKFAPPLLVLVFSDVEVAHFGSYSLHLAGIRNTDRLCYELWEEVKSNREYAGKTTVAILPEFGRDPDGSTTNGFLNHRSFDPSCRSTWMLVMGDAVDRPQVIERPIRHIDLCPTLANLLGCHASGAQGAGLEEVRA
jgi:hypothetical protein